MRESSSKAEPNVSGSMLLETLLSKRGSLLNKHGTKCSPLVFMYANLADSFLKVDIKVAWRVEVCWQDKAETSSSLLLGAVKVSLQPRPSQG